MLTLYVPLSTPKCNTGGRQSLSSGQCRVGGKERRKVQLHREIAEIEKRIQKEDRGMLLRAYILSVTPPERIDNSLRSADDWKQDGVYFLHEPDCLRQVVKHALMPTVHPG